MHTLLRITAAGLVLWAATTTAFAEDSSSDRPDEAAMKAAGELVEQRYQGQMHERIKQGMTRTLIQSMPRLRQNPEPVKKFVDENTDQGELAEQMQREYAKRFTVAELEELTAFYSTDVGQKTLETVPEIERNAMRWSMKRLQQNSDALRKMIQESQQQGQSAGQSSGQGSGQSGGQGQGSGQSDGQ